MKHNWEIRADWENAICHVSQLVNTADICI